MAALSSRDVLELQGLLQDAVVKCSERCLYQSAKWAAELLNSLPAPEPNSPADTEVDSPMDDAAFNGPAVPTGVLSRNDSLREAHLEAQEVSKYLMAKTYFDCREYDRCAAVFLPMTLPRTQINGQASSKPQKEQRPPARSKPNSQQKQAAQATTTTTTTADELPQLSQKALFLALYAKYMSGEKRKEEESEMILGPVDGGATTNRELVSISHLLKTRLERHESSNDSQGWLEYLYGIVLAKSKNTEEAKRWLLKSVNLYAYNWGAWQELGSLVGSMEDLQNLSPLSENLMGLIFHVVQRQELFQSEEELLNQLKQIKRFFPTSSFLKSQKALLYYHGKDFEKAEHIFSKLVTRDPLRIDDLDTYSNILYVMEKRPQLAFLAQLATATDKFRPETCCVVGNYYAMKSEHEKAIMYFRRALTLDRSFLSAWTLMGHEYVELKNTQAAIECYRRAVDANRKDYRAWYGLGQTYEVLEMHFYALFYYEKAAALCPYDPKMWSAVGSCLAKMQRPAQAIKAYKRALVTGSYYEGGAAGSSFGSQATQTPMASRQNVVLDPEVLYAIACMYDSLGDRGETRAYLELVLAQEEGATAGTVTLGEDEDEEAMLRASMTSAATAGGSSQGSGGVGVTATTSRARLWLVKIEMATGGREALRRAEELATELTQDGWEVEEAKSLVRDIRSRLEVEIRE